MTLAALYLTTYQHRSHDYSRAKEHPRISSKSGSPAIYLGPCELPNGTKSLAGMVDGAYSGDVRVVTSPSATSEISTGC